MLVFVIVNFLPRPCAASYGRKIKMFYYFFTKVFFFLHSNFDSRLIMKFIDTLKET